MTDNKDGNVIAFRKTDPSLRLKRLGGNEQRATCKHSRVEIWMDEPILECADCGAVVDPYQWIRDTCRKWKHLEDSALWQRNEYRRETAELKTAISGLRKEYADLAEERRTKQALMVMPPRRAGHYS